MKKLTTILVAGLITTSAFAGGQYQDAVNNLQFITNTSSSNDNLNVNANQQKNINNEKLTAMADDAKVTLLTK